jgi:hypothetical protein
MFWFTPAINIATHIPAPQHMAHIRALREHNQKHFIIHVVQGGFSLSKILVEKISNCPPPKCPSNNNNKKQSF